MRSIEVIINKGSGTAGEDAAQRLAEIFRLKRIDVRISLASDGTEVRAFTQQALRREAQTIVAAGGDGTINAVASLLLNTERQLGVIPLGTFNHFAKDLGVPLELSTAVETILTGQAIKIDVGQVNEHIFLNNSGLGLYPSFVRQREGQQRRGYRKWFAFVRAMFAVLRRYPFLDVRLSVEGKELQMRTPFVFIGNNEYQIEGLNLGERSCLNAGKLSLYVARQVGRGGLLRMALSALFGRLRKTEDIIALCTTELWVETRRKRAHVSTDGEVTTLTLPLHYRILPAALQVIVPAPTEPE
jgi:YegS/Rv2252/BmrU family lipid kinase